MVTFASLSDDWSEVHISEEFAKGTAYGRRIAHGLLGLAITEGLKLRGERIGSRGSPRSAGPGTSGSRCSSGTRSTSVPASGQADDEGSRARDLLPRPRAREPARRGGPRGRAPADGRDSEGGQARPTRSDWDGEPMSKARRGSKVVTAEAAARLIRDGTTVGVEGAGRLLLSEAVSSAIERQFLSTGRPRGLTLLQPCGFGDDGDAGASHFAHEGWSAGSSPRDSATRRGWPPSRSRTRSRPTASRRAWSARWSGPPRAGSRGSCPTWVSTPSWIRGRAGAA